MRKKNVKRAIRMALSVPVDEKSKQDAVYAAARCRRNIEWKIGFFPMLRSTFSHTSVLFWLLSSVLYVAVGLSEFGQSALIIGAPLLAALGFSEWSKSFFYGMWELEKTCRFDLRRLLLLKLALTGLGDFAVLLIANFLTKGEIPKVNCAVCTVAAFMISSFVFFLLFELTRLADFRILLGGLIPLCYGTFFLCRMAGSKNVIGNLPLWLTVLVIFTVAWILLLRKAMRNEVHQNG